MRILLAWADDVSPNLGVRTLARGSMDLLSRVRPDAEFEVMNYGSRPAAVPWGALPLLKERAIGRLGMMEWFSRFDLVWDTRSGDSFADIYGLDRHVMMSLIHEFACQAGAPIVMAPQTIGPFHTRRARMLARRTLHRSSLVFARDPLSATASESLGRPVDLTTTDLVFAIASPQPTTSRDVILNVSGLLWQDNPHTSGQGYRRAIRHIIDSLLAEGRQITLFPHVLASDDPDNDVPAVLAVQREYGDRVEVLIPSGLDEARSVLAGAQIVIAARMHACLNALSAGTPAVAMSYSRKFAPLLGELGWGEVHSLSDPDDAAVRVLQATRDATLGDRAEETRVKGKARIDALTPMLAEMLRERGVEPRGEGRNR